MPVLQLFEVQLMSTKGHVLFVLLLSTGMAMAGDHADWNNLSRLKSGANIQVVQANGLRLEGKYESYSETAITLQTSSGGYSIGKDRVVRISRKPAHRRLRNILIGLGVGVAAGAGLWASAHDGQFYEALIIAPALAATGAAAGAAVPTSLFTTVYRVRKLDRPAAPAPAGPDAPGFREAR